MSRVSEMEVRELDKSLRVDGQDIVLRRLVGTTNQIAVDVRCRAFVRSIAATVTTPAVIQANMKIIMSPTEIINEQWPGGEPEVPPRLDDPRVPRRNDQVIVAGALANVMDCDPIYLANDLIRLELLVRG